VIWNDAGNDGADSKSSIVSGVRNLPQHERKPPQLRRVLDFDDLFSAVMIG